MTDSSLRSTLIVLALFAVGSLLSSTATRAQTPVLEATNSSDEPVLQANEDGGFAALGSIDAGTIPVTGEGTRLMWHPAKAAFRVGGIGTGGTEWDDTNVGRYSVAMGWNTLASGNYAVSLGRNNAASGFASVALGGASDAARALDYGSIAIGDSARATKLRSVAIGYNAVASGEESLALSSYVGLVGYQDAEATAQGAVAIGPWAIANERGAIAIGNAGAEVNHGFSMALSAGRSVSTGGRDQMAFGARQFWFSDGNDTAPSPTNNNFFETATGATLTDGGTWTNSSDATKKEHYRPVDGEVLLRTLREIPVQTWSYKGEPDAVRHMGPTAQDFHAAFDLGSSSTAISTVDIDGVNMAAIQALSVRTKTLKKRNATLEARVARLEKLVRNQSALSAGLHSEILGGLIVLLLLGGGTVLWRVRAQQC